MQLLIAVACALSTNGDVLELVEVIRAALIAATTATKDVVHFIAPYQEEFSVVMKPLTCWKNVTRANFIKFPIHGH